MAELRGLACATETAHATTADESEAALEDTVREALEQAGVAARQIATLCADVSPPRLEILAARICPAWRTRRVSVARWTGHMEGAQILADLGAAWRTPIPAPGPAEYALGLTSSPQGLNCAAVFKRMDKHASGCSVTVGPRDSGRIKSPMPDS